MYFPIPLCHAFIHCWKDSSGMPFCSVVMALLKTSTFSKRVSLIIIFQLKEKEKVTPSQTRGIDRLLQYGDVPLCLELPDAQGVVSRCIGVVKLPRFLLPQLSSHFLQRTKHTLEDLFVDLLVGWTCGKKSLWTMPTSKNVINAPKPLDVIISPTCWRPLASGVIFLHLEPIFEHLVPLKNTCSSHGVISIHLLKHFKCWQRSFLQLD